LKKLLKFLFLFFLQSLYNFTVKLYRKYFKNKTDTYFCKIYGKIYTPFYSLNGKINNNYPDIYNYEGKKMEVFFQRNPYDPQYVYVDSKYFLFDLYNYSLETHFYHHSAILETMGKPVRKYGMLHESEIILPEDYKIFRKHKGLENEYNLIFTYSDEILQSVPNSRFFIRYMRPWYGGTYMMSLSDGFRKNEGILSLDNYKHKSKNISIISSGREKVPLHKFRNSIARRCKLNNLADVFGTIDGGTYCSIEEPLKDYRFSIVIENEITPYGCTEKITNCFAAMTIPVYLGANKIDKLFNSDGIIQFNQNDDIESILKLCTKEYYEERIPAIIDNFNKVNINKSEYDLIYENYIQKDVGKLNPEEFSKLLIK